MRRLALLALASLAACGDVNKFVDAAPSDGERVDAASGAPDAATSTPDATNIACTYVPASATSPIMTFTGAGGAFQSFGCAPIDPTYWMSGGGMTATVTFTNAQDRPSIRVWGMNTDDSASVSVNGAAYALDAASATIAPKVLCGVSPGTEGVAFSGGNLFGANTPSAGNYSYNDVTLEATGVTSIQLAGLTGAGWGFAGVSVGCSPVN